MLYFMFFYNILGLIVDILLILYLDKLNLQRLKEGGHK